MGSEIDKIHIIGAGIMGLMTARGLLAVGKDVVIYDKGEVGSESSWAGGGILSPLYPWRQSKAVTDLALRSQHLYPEIVADLLNQTGIDPELESSGMLILSVENHTKAHAWAASHRVKIRVAESSDLAKIEPALAKAQAKSALVFPEIGHVRNPRLIAALRADLLQKECEIRENSEIKEIVVTNGRIQKLITNQQEIEVRQAIVCAGAWTGKLLTNLGQGVPIEPIAGQMLLYKAEPGVVRNIILNKKRYLIPRRDGRVLVGSTLENAGFNKQTTEEARLSLQNSALELVPALANYPIEAQWAGLRPGSPLGIPYMGVYPGVANLWVCSGHYRNGLVLAPASAEFMVNLILEENKMLNQSEFALDRAS